MHKSVLDLWQRTLSAIETEDLAQVGTEIDWVMKYLLLDRYAASTACRWTSPRIAQLDLAYHDINRRRGLFYLLQRHGRASRITSDLEIFQAKTLPPQTTRAKLRGDFIRARRSTGATSPWTGCT